MKSPQVLLSVVLPCWNEGTRIGPVLESIEQALAGLNGHYEIIAVNDGSSDNTGTLLEHLTVSMPRLRVVNLHYNQGKGAAVRAGVLRAVGHYIAFLDSDGDIDPGYLPWFLTFAQSGYDLVMGSKRHRHSVSDRGPFRRLMSWAWQRVMRTSFGLPVKDPQVGIKMMTNSLARNIFPLLRSTSMGFDLELIWAAYAADYKLLEVPVEIKSVGDSSLNMKRVGAFIGDVSGLYRRGVPSGRGRMQHYANTLA